MNLRVDLTGKKFGLLTALRYSHRSASGIPFWVCSCECGNEKIIDGYCLQKGKTKSCGCLRKSNKHIKRTISPGDRFGRLTIVEELPRKITANGRKLRYMLCKCDCGNSYKVLLKQLMYAKTVSCGCKSKVHGMTKTPIFKIWVSMKSRCYSPSSKESGRYQDRGIIVCEEWKNNFKSFYDWALSNGHQKGLELDRIDNDKGYFPDNCRFVTAQVNCNNRSTTNYVSYQGKKSALPLLLRELNIFHKYELIRHRMAKRKMSFEDAISDVIPKK